MTNCTYDLTGDRYLEAYEEVEAEGDRSPEEAKTQAGTASERATVEDEQDRDTLEQELYGEYNCFEYEAYAVFSDDVSSVITAESAYNDTFNLQESVHFITEDHIKLNRPWLHETQEHVPVSVLVTKPYLQSKLFHVAKRLVNNPVSQTAVTCRMILVDKVAKFVSNLSVVFDDESDMGAACKAAGADLHESNRQFMRYSYKVLCDILDHASLITCTSRSIWIMRMERKLVLR